MCRYNGPRSRLRRWTALLSVPAMLCLAGPAPAEESLPRLHSVILDFAERVPSVAAALNPDWSRKAYENLTDDGRPEALYFITFEEGETFRFIMPVSLTWAFNEPVFADGGTRYAYDRTMPGRTRDLTILIPNQVLRARNEILAAEAYLNEASARTGIPFRLLKPEQPFDVYIGHFSGQGRLGRSGGYATFWNQELRLKQDRTTWRAPIHELFHIATFAVLHARAGDDYLSWYNNAVDRPREVLIEGLADHFTDEPIRVPPGPGQPRELLTDGVNDYVCPSFLEGGETDLFARNEYCTSLLFKYYTEQIAGGRDEAGIDAVLELLVRVHAAGRLTADSLVQAMVEGLPAERFPGATWQERWAGFYTSFAAAALVQRVSAGDGAGGRLGFHDDAFSNLNIATGVLTGGVHEHKEDHVAPPTEIHDMPAGSDEERRARLAPYLQPVDLETYGYAWHGLILRQPNVHLIEPSAAWILATGEEGTEAFLLHQRYPRGNFWWRRNAGRHERLVDFALAPGGPDGGLAAFAAIENLDQQSEYHALWLGLVNTGAPDDVHSIRAVLDDLVNAFPPENLPGMSLAWLITPRLIPYRRDYSDSRHPVHLVDGSAHRRNSGTQFYNGDDMVLEFRSTGKLHLGNHIRTGIPESDHNVRLGLICDDRPVALDGDIGLEGIHEDEANWGGRWYTYRVSARIDPDNAATGECRARLEIASLLNMGGADRQTDESFTFRLDDPVPTVERVRVTAGDTVVYDSAENSIRVIETGETDHELQVSIWFSTDMKSDQTTLTAGFGPPYDSYTVELNPALSDGPSWRSWSHPEDTDQDIIRDRVEVPLRIPAGDVPDGGFLWFAIGGKSYGGVDLDADPATAGNQPDTRHYVMFDIEDYYLATLSMEWRMEGRLLDSDDDSREANDYRETYRPFEIQLRLTPAETGYDDPFRELDYWNRTGTGLQQNLASVVDQRDQWQTYRGNMESMLAPTAPEHRAALEAQIAEVSDQLRHAEAEIAFIEATLAAIAGGEGDFRRLIAFRRGYRSYYCNENLTPPVPARFGGMDGEHRFVFSDGTLRYERYWHYDAPGWSSVDLTQRGWRFTGEGQACPWLDTIRIDAEEFAYLSRLVTDLPVLTIDPGVDVPADIQWNPEGYRGQLENLTGKIREAAEEAVAMAWRLARSDEGVAELSGSYYQPVFHDGQLRMPSLPPGLLLRARYNPGGSWPFPIDGSGNYYAQRSGEAPYREDFSFTFSNREEDGDLDAWFDSVWSDGGSSRHSSGMNRPRFADDDGGYDFQWRYEGGGDQITSYTHDSHPAWEDEFVIITGRAADEVLSGGLSLTFTSGTVNGLEHHQSRFGWRFERNALPASRDDDWPEITMPEPPRPIEIAEAPEEPDDGSGDEPEDRSGPVDDDDADDDPPDRQPADAGEDDGDDEGDHERTQDQPPVDDHDGGDDARPGPSPTRNAGVMVPVAPVNPTIAWPGVLTGAIENGSPEYEPGHVIVWLEGAGLPAADEQPLLMDLHEGLRQALVAIPVGTGIRFRNVEPEGGRGYRLIGEDDDLPELDEWLYPGDEFVLEFPDAGRFTIIDMQNSAYRFEVIVVNGTRINALTAPIYMIRDIPPGTYVLHVETESPRFAPHEREVTVRPVGNTVVDVTLLARGRQLSGLDGR